MDRNRMLDIRMGTKSKPHLEDTPAKKRTRKFLRYGALIVFACYFVAGNRGLLHLVKMKSEEAGLRKEIENLESEHNRTETEKASLKQDLKVVERLAREELGLVKQGEVVFRFVGPGTEESRDK